MNESSSQAPDFRSPAFLLGHVRHTMGFYHPRAIDPSGGFFHFFLDDGQVYDAHTRHLVSSTRFVFNYAMAVRHLGTAAQGRQPASSNYLPGLLHGLAFLRQVHRNPSTGGYAWLLDWREGRAQVRDSTQHCYGLAFVLLAYAHAALAGVEEAQPWIAETFDLAEQRFWESAHGLYADEATPDWRLSGYRGQNANMHFCEALLAAYEATGEPRYLDRAELLADHITRRQAAQAGNLIWEHYRADWSVDWDYNRDDRSNIFRPWGVQPGHLTEWAKLLLTLEAHRPLPWLATRARELFDLALGRAWDAAHGGIHYGLAPDGSVCDSDKYFWVQAESLAAAARLAVRFQEPGYWDWYDRIWAYSWQHFVDHQHGGWWRILDANNRKYSRQKSPAGKVDYHTMGACYEVLGLLKD